MKPTPAPVRDGSRLARLRRKREHLFEAYIEDVITRAELHSRLEQNDAELRSAEDRHAWDSRPMAERREWRGVAGGIEQFGGRDRCHPSLSRIARAQRHLWSRRLSSIAEAIDRCWACGYQCGQFIDKAHIHPVRWGGSDEPWNFLLLCGACHAEQDDDAPRAAQLRWLREHRRLEDKLPKTTAEYRRNTP